MGAGDRQQRTAEQRERARLEREARRGRLAEPGVSELAAPAPDVVSPQEDPATGPPAPAPPTPGPPAPAPPAPGPPAPAPPAPASASASAEIESAPVAVERPPESALRPISVKLPPPAPLPPRIPPPQPQALRPRRWTARLRVGALLLAVAVVLAGIVVFAVVRSKAPAKAPAPLAVVTVTIPEGETAEEIAQIAAAKGLTGSYRKAVRHSTLLDPAHYGAPVSTHSLEGFLFPATYELYARTPARQLVAEQLAAFRENFASKQVQSARALHITPYQLLIVASMIEREALLTHDRSKVAAVIYNRLRLGMPLGIDSTIRYALHDYSKPLTESQLRIDSPYNTRIHHGLPPTPISNPGLAAIEAAAHPAHVPYLYYVNGADGCGELVFSTGYAEFERNAAAYQQALAKHGGRVPSCPKR